MKTDTGRRAALGLLTLMSFLTMARPLGAIDITSNQIGRVTSMGNDLMQVFHEYDPEGRIVATQHVQDGQSRTIRTGYGYPQNPTTTSGPGTVIVREVFPDGEQVLYTHDASGLPVTMRSSFGGAIEEILRDLRVNARGLPTRIDLGNGTVTTWNYDETGHLRLTRLTTVDRTGATIQDYTYEYDGDGNVTAMTDGVKASESFKLQYDELGQLTAMLNPADGVIESYDYDNIGNLTQKGSLSQTYKAGGRPHALARSGTTDYQYDANGNVIGAANLTIEWNADNLPRKVITPAGTTQRWHVGELLWKKVEGGVTTYYMPSLRIENGVARKYYGSYAERSEVPGDRDLRFYHPDHLGSASLVTDKNGNVIRRVSYFPWGGDRGVEGTFVPKLQFNFKERDTATGFYDFGARLYNPQTGRWLSPDRDVSDGLNRYAYVRNNPWTRLDPGGNFSTGMHTYIMRRMFPHMRQQLFEMMDRGSASIDGLTWDRKKPVTMFESEAFKHSMLSYKLLQKFGGNRAKAIAEAERLRTQFIDQKKAQVIAEVARYRELLKEGNWVAAGYHLERAHFAFGEMLHPMLDAKSPEHREWKVFKERTWELLRPDVIGQADTALFTYENIVHHFSEDNVNEIPADVWTDSVPLGQRLYRQLFGDDIAGPAFAPAMEARPTKNRFF
ncbi:MAG TPA: RHS repeat-associated core domain-containing protein [Thermoanaerobaculia bacterium]|jgi:RHS repeat-associated protein